VIIKQYQLLEWRRGNLKSKKRCFCWGGVGGGEGGLGLGGRPPLAPCSLRGAQFDN
jgi:hypothetical protein